MITGVFAFVGAMIGAIFINYVLHEPNHRDENYSNGPKN
jgi:hypothetical protein